MRKEQRIRELEQRCQEQEAQLQQLRSCVEAREAELAKVQKEQQERQKKPHFVPIGRTRAHCHGNREGARSVMGL